MRLDHRCFPAFHGETCYRVEIQPTRRLPSRSIGSGPVRSRPTTEPPSIARHRGIAAEFVASSWERERERSGGIRRCNAGTRCTLNGSVRRPRRHAASRTGPSRFHGCFSRTRTTHMHTVPDTPDPSGTSRHRKNAFAGGRGEEEQEEEEQEAATGLGGASSVPSRSVHRVGRSKSIPRGRRKGGSRSIRRLEKRLANGSNERAARSRVSYLLSAERPRNEREPRGRASPALSHWILPQLTRSPLPPRPPSFHLSRALSPFRPFSFSRALLASSARSLFPSRSLAPGVPPPVRVVSCTRARMATQPGELRAGTRREANIFADGTRIVPSARSTAAPPLPPVPPVPRRTKIARPRAVNRAVHARRNSAALQSLQ